MRRGPLGKRGGTRCGGGHSKSTAALFGDVGRAGRRPVRRSWGHQVRLPKCRSSANSLCGPGLTASIPAAQGGTKRRGDSPLRLVPPARQLAASFTTLLVEDTPLHAARNRHHLAGDVPGGLVRGEND